MTIVTSYVYSDGNRRVITSMFEASNLLEQPRQGTITCQLAAWRSPSLS